MVRLEPTVEQTQTVLIQIGKINAVLTFPVKNNNKNACGIYRKVQFNQIRSSLEPYADAHFKARIEELHLRW